MCGGCVIYSRVYHSCRQIVVVHITHQLPLPMPMRTFEHSRRQFAPHNLITNATSSYHFWLNNSNGLFVLWCAVCVANHTITSIALHNGTHIYNNIWGWQIALFLKHKFIRNTRIFCFLLLYALIVWLFIFTDGFCFCFPFSITMCFPEGAANVTHACRRLVDIALWYTT